MAQNDLTRPEFEAIKHWSMYGRKGQPLADRAKATDWKTKQFSKPVTSEWHLAVLNDDLPAILNGFKPREMEDKWFVYADGPDDHGEANVHFHRSWTGFKVAEVKLVVDEKSAATGGDGRTYFARIIWESDEDRVRQTEADAKETVANVCQWCLDAHSPLKAVSPKEEDVTSEKAGTS